MGFATESVRLRHKLRESDQHVGPFRESGESAESLPETERMRERSGVSDLAVEKHPFSRNEDVLKDHESLGAVVLRRHRKVADVVMPGSVRCVEDLYARRVDGHHAGDRVLLFPGFHRLGRDGKQLVAERGAGDVQLCSPDDNTITLAIHYVHV